MCPTTKKRHDRNLRFFLFRAVAISVPLSVGVAAIVFVLFEQERLVYDSKRQRLKVQAPPVYIQEPGYKQTGHRYLYDETLGWRNIPNWHATTGGKSLTINSKGLRDREYEFEKPANTTRVLVLGDSYVWGYGVADNEVFTEVLESQLANDVNSWEVLNTGVSGWGTDQEYLFLRDEGMRYSPDIVVLAFFLANDLDNISVSRQYAISKPVFLDTNLTLANVPVPRPDSQSLPIRTNADAIDLCIALVKAIKRLCDHHDCRLLVVKFGRFLDRESIQFKEDEQQFERLLEAQLPSVAYCDLDEAFAANDLTKSELIEGNDDGHWNSAGHRAVASILKELLTNVDSISEEPSL